MDRAFTAKHFVGQFDGALSADRQIVSAFNSEFGSPRRGNGGGDRVAADNTPPAIYKS